MKFPIFLGISRAIPAAEAIMEDPLPETERKFEKIIRATCSITLFLPRRIKKGVETFKERRTRETVKSEEREIREMVKYDEKSLCLKLDESLLSEDLFVIISLMDAYVDDNYREVKIYQSRVKELQEKKTVSTPPLSELHQNQKRIDAKSEIERRVLLLTGRLKRQSERDQRLIKLYEMRSSRPSRSLPLEGKFKEFLKKEADLACQRQWSILPQLREASNYFQENDESVLETLQALDSKLESQSKRHKELNSFYDRMANLSIKRDRPKLESEVERFLFSETGERLDSEIKEFA